MNLNDLCKNNFKEINELYNEVSALGFQDEPEYEKYIKILCSDDIIKNHKLLNNDYFCWISKLKKKLNLLKRKKKNLESDKQLNDLFIGYPKEYIKEYLNNF